MRATFINSLNERITFEEVGCSTPYILKKVEVDNPVLLYSNKGMLQDGETYINNTLDVMEVDIHIALRGKTLGHVQALKDRLYKVFNPKIHQGELVYKDKKVKCIINSVPVFSSNNDNLVEGIINLTAFNPYFTDTYMSSVDIALWQGTFHFPLIIPEDEGIIFGYREPNLIVNVENEGQVPTGMIIEFKAVGKVVNPSLFNINTREFIKINKTMTAGELITVNTNYGSKTVIQKLNGIETSIMNYLDVVGGGDTFLQLDVGDNLFRYDADEGIDNLEVTIHYYNKYLGV